MMDAGNRKATGGAMKGIGAGLGILGGILMFTPLAGLGACLLGVGVGVTLAGMAIYNMNFGIPTVKDRVSPKQDPSIRGGSNQARPYGSIPVTFGRHLLSPDYAAMPYTHVTSDAQWLRQIFCLGYDDQEIELDSLKLGETKFVDFSETKDINKILSGEDALVRAKILRGGATPTYYPRVCKEEAVNAVLKNMNDSDSSGEIIRTTAPNCRMIEVDIFFPSGLFQYNDKGKVVHCACGVGVWYKPAGTDDSHYIELHTWNLNLAQAKTVRRSAQKTGLEPGAYTVKVARLSPDTDDTKIIDEVYLGSIRSYTTDRPVREERAKDLLLLETQIKASDMAQGVIQNLNCVVQSKFPDWTGSGSGPESWTARLTQNPASCVLYCLRGKINREPVKDELIDWVAFEHWWSFCDSRGIKFNAILSDDRTISELISLIALVGRANIVKIDGFFTVTVDEYKNVPVQMFTPRNSISFTEQICMSEIPNQIDYNFIDEAGGWAQNTLSVYNTASGNLDPDNPSKGARQETSVWGITNASQLFKFARYQQAVSKLRRSIYSITADVEFIMCQKGDLIEYAGDAAMTGIAYGRVKELIKENGKIAGIISDTLLEFGNEEYGLRIRNAKSGITTVYLENLGTSDYMARFENPIDGGVAEGDLFTFGVRNKISRQLVVIEMIPGENLTAEIRCVDLAPGIFGVDNYNYVVPPFDSKLTTGGLVDGSYEDTKLWNTYRTYNDSAERPAKPTGDGTSNGWHKIHTAESRWESHKTARNIFEGDWSAPLATVEQVEEKVNEIPAADTTPPTVPQITTIVGTEYGNATITFSPSTDSQSGVASYNVWRRKKSGSAAQTRWQIVGKVSHEENASEFIYADIPGKFERYLYAVSALDRNSNESAKSASVEFYSEVTKAPDAPARLSAIARKDYVSLECEPVSGADAADTALNYAIEYSKDGGETWSAAIEKSWSFKAEWRYDREVDGWPEKSDFANWKFRVKAVSVYNLSSQWKACEVDDTEYKTWLPEITSFTATAEEGLVRLNWNASSDVYGELSYAVSLNGTQIASGIRTKQYIYEFQDYKEASDFEGMEFTVTATSESGATDSEDSSVDTTGYSTYEIGTPAVTASALEDGIHASWSEPTSHYLNSVYDVYLDNVKVAEGLSGKEFVIPITGFPTSAQMASKVVSVTARSAADSASGSANVSVTNYKSWTPSVPSLVATANGRLAILNWQSQNIWGEQGCDVQVAKAYKLVDNVYTTITDASELVWYAPAMGANPYSSLDAYKSGNEGGYLEVNGKEVSFALPLYGQPDASVPTQYAYRIRAFSKKGSDYSKSSWSNPFYIEAKPISAADVVKAWKLNDKGEKVRIDGSLGVQNIFVEELSALSAKMGLLTDGGMRDGRYNYHAFGDILDEQGNIDLYRGEFRVGDDKQYIKVARRRNAQGQVEDGFDVTFVVGDFQVSATGTRIDGNVFEVYDDEENLLFKVSPQGNRMSVEEGYVELTDPMDSDISYQGGDPTFVSMQNSFSFCPTYVCDGHAFAFVYADFFLNQGTDAGILLCKDNEAVIDFTYERNRILDELADGDDSTEASDFESIEDAGFLEKSFSFKDYDGLLWVPTKYKSTVKGEASVDNDKYERWLSINFRTLEIGRKIINDPISSLLQVGESIGGCVTIGNYALLGISSTSIIIVNIAAGSSVRCDLGVPQNATLFAHYASIVDGWIYFPWEVEGFLGKFTGAVKINPATGASFLCLSSFCIEPTQAENIPNPLMNIKCGADALWACGEIHYMTSPQSYDTCQGIVSLAYADAHWASDFNSLQTPDKPRIWFSNESCMIPIMSNTIDGEFFVLSGNIARVWAVDGAEIEHECWIEKGSVNHETKSFPLSKIYNAELLTSVVRLGSTNPVKYAAWWIYYNYNEERIKQKISTWFAVGREVITGRSDYETGIGFSKILLNKSTGNYRYVLDSGAYLDFDEDGRVVASGERGPQGPQGATGAKGEKGDPALIHSVSVEAIPEGQTPSVRNDGTESNADFVFSLPINSGAAAQQSAASALVSEGWAKGTQNGDAVSSGTYYQDNAKYYKEQAEQSATNASTSETNAGAYEFNAASSADFASANALKSEGYANGKQDGTRVESGSPYYENNSEHFKNKAEEAALAARAYASIVLIASGTQGQQKTVTLPTGFITEGQAIKVVFPNGHTVSTDTAMTLNESVVVSNQDGALAPLSRHQLTAGTYSVLMPHVCLDMYYTADYDGHGTPAWVVVGNPIVLSSSTYSIYADGHNPQLDAHPIGSLYWSSNSTNPKDVFGGGTWTAITDKFISAAGTKAVNATGGAETVTLSTTQIPSHSHGMDHWHYIFGESCVQDGGSGLWCGDGGHRLSSVIHSHGGRTQSLGETYNTSGGNANFLNTGGAGDGGAHENMPPYIVKYCWERTA